jgi:hypothetical protein
MLVNESNVVNGEHHLGTISSPFWPCESGEVNIAGDVQDVCIECPGLPDDLPTVPPAFTEVCRLDPFRRGFIRPSIGNFPKRLLNAEVSKGAFFAEEPGDFLFVRVAIHLD